MELLEKLLVLGPTKLGIILGVLLEIFRLALSAFVIYFEVVVKWIVPPRRKSLNGEVILITGSAGGLGQEMCKQLATSGAKLVLWDITEDMNKKTAKTLRELGAQHVFEDTVDITDREEVVKAAGKVRNLVGHVTILVNNAGIAPVYQFLDMPPAAVRKTFDVNVISHFWTIQEFLPHMIQNNHGHIVTIASTMSLMSMRGSAPYAASKHSVHGMIECLKNELICEGHTNVKFTTAYPFFIKTNLLNDSSLQLKFKYSWLTPFMDATFVAEKIVDAVKCETEFLHLPKHFRYFFLLQGLIPSKLYHRIMEFVIEECNIQTSVPDLQQKGKTESLPNNKSKKTECATESQNTPSLKFQNSFLSPISKTTAKKLK